MPKSSKAKPEVDSEKEQARKVKTELFKRLFLEDDEPDYNDPVVKAKTFADLVAGKDPKKFQSRLPAIPSNPLKEMQDFMKDPFDSKGWAKSKQIKKPSDEPVVEMVIAEPSEEELAAFWASRPADDE